MSNEKLMELRSLAERTSEFVPCEVYPSNLLELCDLVIGLKYEVARLTKKLAQANEDKDLYSRQLNRYHEMGQ